MRFTVMCFDVSKLITAFCGLALLIGLQSSADAGFMSASMSLQQEVSTPQESYGASATSTPLDERESAPEQESPEGIAPQPQFGSLTSSGGVGTQSVDGPSSGVSPFGLVSTLEIYSLDVVARLQTRDRSLRPHFHPSRLFRPPRVVC